MATTTAMATQMEMLTASGWLPPWVGKCVVWASNFNNLSGVKTVPLKPSIFIPYGLFPFNVCTIALWRVMVGNATTVGKVCSSKGEGRELPSSFPGGGEGSLASQDLPSSFPRRREGAA